MNLGVCFLSQVNEIFICYVYNCLLKALSLSSSSEALIVSVVSVYCA